MVVVVGIVYWHSNLVTFSDLPRMLAHIDTGNRKFDVRGNQTHNRLEWVLSDFPSLGLVDLQHLLCVGFDSALFSPDGN